MKNEIRILSNDYCKIRKWSQGLIVKDKVLDFKCKNFSEIEFIVYKINLSDYIHMHTHLYRGVGNFTGNILNKAVKEYEAINQEKLQSLFDEVRGQITMSNLNLI